MPPIDTQPAKWAALVYKLGAALAVLFIIAAGEFQVILANRHASDAANEARSIAACVNQTLAERNPATVADQKAHVAKAQADKVFASEQRAWAERQKAWTAVLQAAMQIRAGSNNASETIGEFKAATRAYNTATAVHAAAAAAYAAATTRYQVQLDADQKLRDRHPLGHC